MKSKYTYVLAKMVARMVQSAQRLAMDWMVRDQILVGEKF
jgi:hypothetical protein